MASDNRASILRAFVEIFPPLKWALRINDLICFTIRFILKFIYWIISLVFKFIYATLIQFLSLVVRLFQSTFGINLSDKQFRGVHYKRIDSKPISHREPIPYRKEFLKRILTYYGGLILGTILYLFVYFVLIKHHSLTSITVAFLLMLAYLVVLENSHNMRSILMLCLPIMFTNRGRALVFCCMLTIMATEPLINTQSNVNELHRSLKCCGQYLTVKSDRAVEQDIIEGLIKVEDVVYDMIDSIILFASEVREKFHKIITLAVIISNYITQAIKELKEIVDVCNTHIKDAYNNCLQTFDNAYKDCKYKLGSSFDFLCEIVDPLKGLCELVELPETLCEAPQSVVLFLNATIGVRLEAMYRVINNEFYVEIDVNHNYSYEAKKSKEFKTVIEKIKYDIESKFWYIHFIARVFNLVSLILVIWITVGATLYHMHYLHELNYDNVYLDNYLYKIEAIRQGRKLARRSDNDFASNNNDRTMLIPRESNSNYSDRSEIDEEQQVVDDDDDEEEEERKYLFPMTKWHERAYYKPFSLYMNEVEKSKLYLASFIWLVIVGYISFFVLMDYSLYELIEFINEILRDILFKSDLPLVEISTKSGDNVIHYNRTYLRELRAKLAADRVVASNLRQQSSLTNKTGSLSSMYRRLMDSLEKNIPDDIVILESLETCLPKASKPNYNAYKNLGYLALLTFGAVLLEAYALRTRHCIANLYYPKRARKRAIWFYRKLINEKPKFEIDPKELAKDMEDDDVRMGRGNKMLQLGFKVLAKRVKTG